MVPSSLMRDLRLCSPEPPCIPAVDTLTRVVVPATRSWTKTSDAPLVSDATRLVACDVKVT